jgi:hypothetical protein
MRLNQSAKGLVSYLPLDANDGAIDPARRVYTF